jgi:hypothetical protein
MMATCLQSAKDFGFEMLFRNDAVYAWCQKNYTKMDSNTFVLLWSTGQSCPIWMLKNLWFCCVSTARLDKTIINQNSSNKTMKKIIELNLLYVLLHLWWEAESFFIWFWRKRNSNELTWRCSLICFFSEEEIVVLNSILEELKGNSIQYLLGSTSFYGLDFEVNPNVLIKTWNRRISRMDY